MFGMADRCDYFSVIFLTIKLYLDAAAISQRFV